MHPAPKSGKNKIYIAIVIKYRLRIVIIDHADKIHKQIFVIILKSSTYNDCRHAKVIRQFQRRMKKLKFICQHKRCFQVNII